MLAIAIAYLLIVRLVGYVPAIAALIIASAVYGGAPFGWRVLAIGGAGHSSTTPSSCWLLGIPLPAGPLLSLF